jgi:hypothetical protein
VPIVIRKVESGYTAHVSPPDGAEVWQTKRPVTAREVLASLRELGCHTTDIADAFSAANPDWLSEVD